MLYELIKAPFAWLLRCRGCGVPGLPEAHLPDCPRLWRNGGEITGAGDAWYKANGYARDGSDWPGRT